jgi:dihydroneopterin aldolase
MSVSVLLYICVCVCVLLYMLRLCVCVCFSHMCSTQKRDIFVINTNTSNSMTLLAKIGFAEHRVTAIIGCNHEERLKEQDILVSLEVVYDIEKAVENDDVTQTCDYSKMKHIITRTSQEGKFKLIETLASRCLDAIVDQFPSIHKITITVTKCLVYKPFVTIEKTLRS